MSIRKMYKPTDNLISEQMAIALESQSKEEWRKKILNTIAKNLLDDPLQYRSFGPYWWVLKQELIKEGILSFGTFLDAEWLEIADCGNGDKNIIAAWLYQEYAIEAGLFYSNGHGMSFFNEKYEIWEDEEVFITDEEVELLETGK